jgi:hypothetical protein
MNTLTPDQIDRLARLVDSKGWTAFDFSAHPQLPTIEAISRMLQDLSTVEVDLSLDLLEDYLIVKDYIGYARQLMLMIRDLAADQSILVTPILDYKSERTKSGHALHYEMSNFTSLLGNSSVAFRDDPKLPFCQSHAGIHVSVDDFIGTGNQFNTMIESIEAEEKTNSIRHVAAICIQETAKIAIESAGYTVISCLTLGKGLDRLASRRGVPRDLIVSEYTPMENRTGCGDIYRLGRDQTEALVTLKATPNNTLPIFWMEGKFKWPAPFPRPRR